MNAILLGSSVLLFAMSVGILLYVRYGLVQYTTQLMYSLDAILAGDKEIDFWENKETLNGKLQAKLCQLGEVMEQSEGESAPAAAARDNHCRYLPSGKDADCQHTDVP